MQFGSYNKTEHVGRLGKDPELQVTAEGTPVTKFSLAVDVYKGKGSDGKPQNDTMWLNIICWRQLAEMTEKFLVKGDQVLVVGKLSIRKYVDKSGVSRQTVEIIADEVVKLSSSKNGNTPESSGGSSLGDFSLPDDL